MGKGGIAIRSRLGCTEVPTTNLAALKGLLQTLYNFNWANALRGMAVWVSVREGECLIPIWLGDATDEIGRMTA